MAKIRRYIYEYYRYNPQLGTSVRTGEVYETTLKKAEKLQFVIVTITLLMVRLNSKELFRFQIPSYLVLMFRNEKRPMAIIRTKRNTQNTQTFTHKLILRVGMN